MRVTEVVRKGENEQRRLRACSIEVREPRRLYTARIDRTPFRIGSHAANDLTIDDETVSKHHLEITAEPEGYRLVDLSSSNGTFVGNLRVGELSFAEPIEVRLGETTLELRPSDEQLDLPAADEARFGSLIGRSVVMRELFARLGRIAAADCPVLIEGETGVGKELVAENLHAASPRAAGPFVVVQCAAVAHEVLETELFGHLRGAFTGAEATRQGLAGLADGGTLFLDVIEELPARLQAKLVALIDRGELRPVGANHPRTVDVRVVAASRVDLAPEVNRGLFRADLFYRLAVARLQVPPLRQRSDDVPLLAQAFLEQLRAREGERVPVELSAVTLARLAAQPWPGNVRELRNAIERAVLRGSAPQPPSEAGPFALARDQFIDEFTKKGVLEALERADGRIVAAAKLCGVQVRYFRRLVQKYGGDVAGD